MIFKTKSEKEKQILIEGGIGVDGDKVVLIIENYSK